MEGQLAVPFHFAAEFLILAVSIGACLDGLRRARSGGGIRAGVQALGFAVLAAAQILHGAGIHNFTDDGSTAGIVARAAGFLLVALGALASGEHTVGNAMPALGILPLVSGAAGLFHAGSAAQLALVPACAAAIASARGFAAHRRDQDPASFAFTAAFASFATGEVLLAITPPAGGPMLIASHALRFAGALLLSRWLASAIGRSVRLRFVAAFVVALTVLVLVVSGAFNAVIAGNLTTQEFQRLEVTNNSQLSALTTQFTDKSTVNNLAHLSNGVLSDRKGLSTIACLYPELDFLIIVKNPNKLVYTSVGHYRAQCDFSNVAAYVATHSAPQLGTSLKLGVPGTKIVGEALRGNVSAGLAVLPKLLVSVSAAPIAPSGDLAHPIGALVIGRVIDSRTLYRQCGCASQGAPTVDSRGNLTVVVGGEVLASTLPKGVADSLVRGIETKIQTVVEENGSHLRETRQIGGTPLLADFAPIHGPRNETIGVLGVSEPQSGLRESQRALNRLLFLIALAAAAIAAVIAWGAGGRMTRPIRALTLAAEAVRRGDLSARAPAQADGGDELAALGRSFNQMAQSLDRSTGDLRAAALTESDLRGQLEAIMQSMGDALIATNDDGIIVTANIAAEKLIGARAVEMQGRMLGEVLTGTDNAGEPLAQASMTRPSLMGAVGAKRTPVAITAAPLRDSAGASSGRVIVLRDVSAEMQAEKMKSEFLSNVSHELRTPLTPIKGYTEILKRKRFSKEKSEEFLDGILDSTLRLERIVEILVDFAAMEAGRLKPRVEPVDVKAFVADTVQRWRERGNGSFKVKIPANLPAAGADPRLLSKSLDELIDNAVKFSPSGPRVEIEVHASANGGRAPKSITIAVKDHGLGIAHDKLPDLFQDFQQLDGSETREYGGMGLGLAYVKRVASVHGGDVSAQSTPGRGSTFSLTLPAADRNGAGGTPRSTAASKAAKRRKTVAGR